jgi:hypothetical protein
MSSPNLADVLDLLYTLQVDLENNGEVLMTDDRRISMIRGAEKVLRRVIREYGPCDARQTQRRR